MSDRVEEIRREHAPTPGDDHCACGVRYGVGCWVGDLLTAYDALRVLLAGGSRPDSRDDVIG